jgi:phosphatidylglycerol:prolipoprotein diacylglycerol transferase
MSDTSPTVHHPFSYGVGPLELTGFGLAVLLAFLIAQLIAQRELYRRGQLREMVAIPDLLVAAILGGLLGAKLYYVLVIAQDLREIFTREGFVFWGGLIGGAIAVYWSIQRRRLSVPRIADVAGPAIAAAYAVGRTGCWAVGDDYGAPWGGWPWPGGERMAVEFPHGAPPSTAQTMLAEFGVPMPPDTAPDAVLAVHPTQLYETAMGVAMFLLLWRMRGHRRGEGWLFGAYLVLAGVERFIVEIFRAKDDRILGPITLAQVLALGCIGGGAYVMSRTRRVRPGANEGVSETFEEAVAG